MDFASRSVPRRNQLSSSFREKRCVVMLANDVRAERIYPELARLILGDSRMPWTWEYDWLQTDRR